MTNFVIDEISRCDEPSNYQGEETYHTDLYLLDDCVYESMENLLDDLKKWQFVNIMNKQ